MKPTFKSIRSYEKKIILGTSDTWFVPLTQRASILYWRLSDFCLPSSFGVLFFSFDLCNKQFITFYFLPLHFVYSQPILNKRFPNVHFMPLLTIKNLTSTKKRTILWLLQMVFFIAQIYGLFVEFVAILRPSDQQW